MAMLIALKFKKYLLVITEVIKYNLTFLIDPVIVRVEVLNTGEGRSTLSTVES